MKKVILYPHISFSVTLFSGAYGQRLCQVQPSFSSLLQKKTYQDNPQACLH